MWTCSPPCAGAPAEWHHLPLILASDSLPLRPGACVLSPAVVKEFSRAQCCAPRGATYSPWPQARRPDDDEEQCDPRTGTKRFDPSWRLAHSVDVRRSWKATSRLSLRLAIACMTTYKVTHMVVIREARKHKKLRLLVWSTAIVPFLGEDVYPSFVVQQAPLAPFLARCKNSPARQHATRCHGLCATDFLKTITIQVTHSCFAPHQPFSKLSIPHILAHTNCKK